MGVRIYRFLLRLWPRAARREYGDEMIEVVQERRAELGRAVGPVGRARFWARQYWALVRGRGAATRRGDRGASAAAHLDGLGHDVRHAVRGLLRRPGFSVVAALTLAVGIGASTSIFSAIHAVLLRPLPFGDAGRMVVVVQESRETGEVANGASAANVLDLGRGTELLEHTAVADPYSYDLQVDGRAESVRAWQVAEGFLESLGVPPLLGRPFTPDDFASEEPVILLSEASWMDRFGGDPDIVGSTVILDGQARTVLGVMPSRLSFPGEVEVWAPRPPQPYDPASRTAAYMPGVALLAPGASLAQARIEADRVARSIAETYPAGAPDLAFRLTPVREYLFGDVGRPLWILAGAVGLLLLIASANVAGLLVARGLEREREFAVRNALGASRARLLRLMGAEALVLAGVGGALGIVLTLLGVSVIRALAPDLPRIDTLTVNGAVLGFALVATTASALLAALLPAVRFARHATGLGEGGRGQSTGRRGIRLRNRLVVLEVAGALVLLVGAGLLAKSFANVLNEELGFEADHRLAVQVFAYGYGPGERSQFVNAAIDNMMAIPGVDSVALTSNVPTSDDGVLAALDIDQPFTIEGRPLPPPGQGPRAWVVWASQGLFDVLGQPMVEGRGFRATDDATSPLVTVVNETFARRYFDGTSPVGEVIRTPSGDSTVAREIVGVVGDTRPRGHTSAPRVEFFLPLSQSGTGSLTFVLRTDVPPETIAEAARQAIWDANPLQSIWGAASLETLLADRLAERRFNMALLSAFATLALFLASIGIYGLVSYSVQMRRTELGIRRALGSPPSEILVMILREGGMLGATGVIVGAGGALVATRFMRGMLFEVQPHDPQALVALSTVVLGVSVVAALVPALRARSIDPAEALRAD